MMEAAIGWAQRRGVDTIDLTSDPTRIAASSMYLSLGFTQRDTTVYRYQVNRYGTA